MMSTKFTRPAFPADLPAPLLLLLATANRWVLLGLLQGLSLRGHDRLSESHLMLLANLDCGATHASAVAHRMGITRQAMNRTMREMEALGYLTLATDAGRANTKLIVMTPAGLQLARDARSAMAAVEAALDERIGAVAVQSLRGALERPWGDSPAP